MYSVKCLRTLVSSQLHFNMCNLESSIVKNVNIHATVKSTIPSPVSYSCQYWADHLVNAPSDQTLMEAVKFVMYEKLLFWLEAMSLLGKTYEASLVLRRALGWKVCLQFISCNASLMLAGQTLNPDHELFQKNICLRCYISKSWSTFSRRDGWVVGAWDLNAESPTTDARGWTFEPHLDH